MYLPKTQLLGESLGAFCFRVIAGVHLLDKYSRLATTTVVARSQTEEFYVHPDHPYLFALNTGCCSIVCEMKLRRADHRPAVGFDSVLASPVLAAGADVMFDISVKFLLKRSRSNFSSFSRRFRAPGLCLRVFCLITFT